MLVARERFDYQDLPLYEGTGPSQLKRVRRINAKTRFVYCSLVLMGLCLAFLVTSRYAQITSVGYEIVTLKKEMQSLDTENQLLQNKLAELNSLQHIEYVATTKLGMEKPELAEGVQFVPAEYSKAGLRAKELGPESASNAVAQDAVTPTGGERNFLVQALASLING